MKFGRVVGRVTFNKIVPSLEGGRFLLASPMTREQVAAVSRAPEGVNADPGPLSNAPSPVVYDAIGGWLGDVIGYEEGREAAMPFNEPTPVDAYNVMLIEKIHHEGETD